VASKRWPQAVISCFGVTGAPRSMKMGTTASPWRYDAAARHALQSVNLRRPAILHYASWPPYLRYRRVVRLPFDSGPRYDVARHGKLPPRRHEELPPPWDNPGASE